MSPELALSLLTQSPARLRALRASYGIVTTPSTQAKARKLAPTVTAFRPGVYRVGACICDLWRMSCTCKAARRPGQAQRQAEKPCPHFVALYLAGEWCPADPDPVLYLKSVGVERPEIIALYARVSFWWGRLCKPFTARIEPTGIPGCFCAILPDGAKTYCQAEHIRHILPFYE